MFLRALIPTGVLSLLALWLVPAVQANYFIVTQPTAGAVWQNGNANLVTWTKGVLDGIDGLDVEMSRLSQDGLIYIARDAPAKPGKLNILIQDIPEADDYFLMFVNSTSGIMFGASSKFSISNQGNGTTPTTDSSVPTVTVSGSPNPTAVFATTFPPNSNGVATPGWKAVEGSMPQIIAFLSAMMACLLGGAITLL